MQRRIALEKMEDKYIHEHVKKSTRKNHQVHLNQYWELCDFAKIKAFPVTEFKLCKFATFLAQRLKTIQSIKAYCATVCDESEFKGFRPVRRGIKYYRTINGIKRTLHHKVKHAEPMTPKLLKRILKVVDFRQQKQMVTWVIMVSGFHMILRKSNLVPLSQVHDMVHNIYRTDIRYDAGVMVVVIRCSKTN